MPFGEGQLKSKFLKLIKSIVVGKVSWCFAKIYLLNYGYNVGFNFRISKRPQIKIIWGMILLIQKDGETHQTTTKIRSPLC